MDWHDEQEPQLMDWHDKQEPEYNDKVPCRFVHSRPEHCGSGIGCLINLVDWLSGPEHCGSGIGATTSASGRVWVKHAIRLPVSGLAKTRNSGRV